MGKNKKLRRIPAKGWLGGVCAGFAYYFSVPVWAVRLAWTLAIFAGMGFIFYSGFLCRKLKRRAITAKQQNNGF